MYTCNTACHYFGSLFCHISHFAKIHFQCEDYTANLCKIYDVDTERFVQRSMSVSWQCLCVASTRQSLAKYSKKLWNKTLQTAKLPTRFVLSIESGKQEVYHTGLLMLFSAVLYIKQANKQCYVTNILILQDSWRIQEERNIWKKPWFIIIPPSLWKILKQFMNLFPSFYSR